MFESIDLRYIQIILRFQEFLTIVNSNFKMINLTKGNILKKYIKYFI